MSEVDTVASAFIVRSRSLVDACAAEIVAIFSAQHLPIVVSKILFKPALVSNPNRFTWILKSATDVGKCQCNEECTEPIACIQGVVDRRGKSLHSGLRDYLKCGVPPWIKMSRD